MNTKQNLTQHLKYQIIIIWCSVKIKLQYNVNFHNTAVTSEALCEISNNHDLDFWPLKIPSIFIITHQRDKFFLSHCHQITRLFIQELKPTKQERTKQQLD